VFSALTQMQAARQGIITEEMRIVAQDEGVDPEWLREQIAKGRVVIPRNKPPKLLSRRHWRGA